MRRPRPHRSGDEGGVRQGRTRTWCAVETTDRGCGASATDVQQSADAVPVAGPSMVRCPRTRPIPRLANPPVDYDAAEGLDQSPPVHVEITAAEFRRDRARREWLMIGLALSVLVTVMAIVVAVFGVFETASRPRRLPPRPPRRFRCPRRRRPLRRWPTPRASRSRSSTKVDPTLPAVPPGAGEEVQGRRLPARHAGLQGSCADGDLELRVNGKLPPRHRRLRADGRQRGRHGRLHARQRLDARR